MKVSTDRRVKHLYVVLLSAVTIFLGDGCSTPIGADRVPARLGYRQVEMNAISAGEPSAHAEWIIRRYGLEEIAQANPEEAVRLLHAHAVRTRDRDILYALAELSFVAGDSIRKSVQPWDPRDARDFYLGAALYAYWYLFADDVQGPKPTGFDRRFRNACDIYNIGLGLAFKGRRSTNDIVYLESGVRKLPVGEIKIEFNADQFPWDLNLFDKFLLADEFTVRGFSVRVREPGVGVPLLAVSDHIEKLRMSRTAPATALLRVDSSLDQLGSSQAAARLQLLSIFDQSTVKIGEVNVPIEADITAARAYTLSQSFAWKAERLQFLNPAESLASQMIQTSPYRPGLIPVVFVHGTFSSPVWWAEMFNTLTADPELRQRCQFWLFLYSSSNPVLLSAAELRQSITNLVQKLDPDGKDAALQDMVVIGHSQGGLLTKLTATETTNALWAAISKKPVEELKATEEEKAVIRRYFYMDPLPCVKRVVFISTPHRGSFLAGNFLRNLIRKLVSTPSWMAREGRTLFKVGDQLDVPKEMTRKQMTSIDSMSPKNPTLRALAELPVATNVTAHSIIAVKEKYPDIKIGNDGVVEYTSAHVDYSESEFIARSFHSCQSRPEVIEEVRRILHQHLDALTPGAKPKAIAAGF